MFPHERRAKMVQMCPAIQAFFQNGRTGGFWESYCHDTKPFSGNMTVKGGEGVHG